MAIAETRMILEHVGEPGYTPDIGCYVRHGGYEVLRKALARDPKEVCAEVETSGLRGRGGAGFPAGTKWKFLDRQSGKPIYLICNADESEPGTFKDRQVVHKDPHQLIEGMMITAYAVQAAQAFIYIREEMPEGARILRQAIAEAKEAGWVGDSIGGSGYSCEIVVHRGAGAYICGEETGLIESLEGRRPYPRVKPPYFPATLGLYHCPTVVNNVETLCHVKHVIQLGGAEYARIGTPNNTGTRIWCVSGHVQRPGVYEFPCGAITLGQLIFDVCGGLRPGRTLKAVIPGGTSSNVLRADERFRGSLRDGTPFDWGIEDIPLDFDSFQQIGCMSGSGGVIVMDDTTNMVEALRNIVTFFAHESCSQCTPCRMGTQHLLLILDSILAGTADRRVFEQMRGICETMRSSSLCGLGQATPNPVLTTLQNFEGEIASYLERASQNGVSGVTACSCVERTAP